MATSKKSTAGATDKLKSQAKSQQRTTTKRKPATTKTVLLEKPERIKVPEGSQFLLRFRAPGQHAALKASAIKNMRSLNTEILFRLFGDTDED